MGEESPKQLTGRVTAPQPTEDNNMKRFVPEQYGITSLAEAEKFAELTDRIVVNLKAIEEGETDIVDLFQTTNAIAGNLQVIDNDCNDLDALYETTNTITGNLSIINADENDLDELERQTNTITSNLTTINR